MNKKIKTDAIFNLIYQLMVIIIPLITTPYISRILGVSNVGVQSYTLSIVTYFTLFAAFGLNDYGQREIAIIQDDKVKTSKLFLEMIANRFLTTFIVLTVYLFFIFTILEPVYKIYYLIMTMNIIAIAFDITWFFQGIEKFKSLAVRNMIIKLLGMISIFLFVKEENDLWLYVLINSLSLLLSSLSMWLLVPKYIIKVKIEFKKVLYHFKGALIYFIPAIAIQIYTIVDKSMINWITNSTIENGVYEQAEKIAKVSLTVIQFMNTIMRSRLSYLFQYKRFEEAKAICDESLQLLSILIFPSCLGVILVAPNLVPLYLGPGYDKSIILIQILSLLIIFIGYSGFVGSHYMNPIGKQSKSNVVLILGSIVNVILNLILIKPFGSIGATIASVTAEAFIALLYIYNGHKFIPYVDYIKVGFKKLISALIMFFSVYFIFLNSNLSHLYLLILKIILGVLIYGVSLLILQDRTALKYIKKILVKFKLLKEE